MYMELTKKEKTIRKKSRKKPRVLRKVGRIIDLSHIHGKRILLDDIIDVDFTKSDMVIFKTKYDINTEKTPMFEKEAILFLEHMGIEIICTDYELEGKEVFMYMMWTRNKKIKFIDGIENISLLKNTEEDVWIKMILEKNNKYKIFIEIDEDIENRNEECVKVLSNILGELKNLVYLKKDYLPISLTNIQNKV